MIEEANRLGRRCEESDQDFNGASLEHLYFVLAGEKTPLSWRGIPHVRVTDDAYFEPPAKLGRQIAT